MALLLLQQRSSSVAAAAATAHSPKTQVECIISKWKKSSKRPFFLLCLSRSASMHVQLLVKVNYNMMITTTSIVGTYHHHINLKWNSLGHNQMRKRGHTIKKKVTFFQFIYVIFEIFCGYVQLFWKIFFSFLTQCQ